MRELDDDMKEPRRKPNRLINYDYSSNGAYFVTICTEKRKKLFCEIVGDGFAVPLQPGIVAAQWVEKIPIQYPVVSVDHYVVMPNHIHLLLRFESVQGTADPSPTLGAVVGWYKYQVTRELCNGLDSRARVFQRSFHDHVIRGNADYQKIWEYIDTNPLRWTLDCHYVP